MDKKGFLNLFKKEDENRVLKLWEDILLAESIDFPIQTEEFYPPNISFMLERININKMKFLFEGLTLESEKKSILIMPSGYSGDLPSFNNIFFKINGSNKFKELYHKDFLGSLMALGIKREILGDIIVENNIAYGIINEGKYNLIEDIEKIGNVGVSIEKISKENIPVVKFQSMSGTISSLRLDNFVSEISNLSRQKAVDLIEGGLVMINYNISKNKSLDLKEGDIITVKKIGKFIFEKNLGENKKGKIKVSIKKFI